MAAITESTSIAAVMDLAKTLESSAQYDLAMTLLSNLKGWMGGADGGKRKRKQRKQKDPNAPKREVKPDSYIALVNKHVWPILDEMSKAADLDADAKKQMRSVKARTQIGKMLWDARVEPAEDKAAAIAELTREQIVAVFEEWKVNPPVKDESAKAKKSKLAGMTEEEKAAFFKARGAKAAAARAAKKAAAGGESKPAKSSKKPAAKPTDDDDASSVSSAESSDSDSSAESEAEEQEQQVKPTVWEHAMKGADKPTKYERVDIDGKVFLYDLKTNKFLGQWDEKKNKIDSKAEDPCA
jgi:cell division septation protein DedD